MIAVALSSRLTTTPDFERVQREIAALAVPYAIVAVGEGGAIAACEPLMTTYALPPERLWFASPDEPELQSARDAGLNAVPVRASAAEVLEAIREPYTRSLLNLRHIMRTALEWRPGHVINPEDVEGS